MQLQTIFKAGNSNVIALPKDLGFKVGDKVIVNPGLASGSAFITKANGKKVTSSITPEFIEILEGINKRYGKALSTLAQK